MSINKVTVNTGLFLVVAMLSGLFATATEARFILTASNYKIKEGDRSCAGFPKLAVKTADGLCLGLVLDRSAFADKVGRGKFLPRTIRQIPGTEDFLVTDMGGWWPRDAGRVWRLRKTADGYRAEIVFRRLIQAHGLQVGPDGWFYVGEAHQIFRFDAHAAQPKREVVVQNLPSALHMQNIHPLTEFVFDQAADKRWDMIVNAGAPSDTCRKALTSGKICKESDQAPRLASLRRYRYNGNRTWSADYSIEARGLRNSIALVSHKSGTILQAENGTDFEDAKEPHDEINIVKKGRHYGWPYCYNFRATTPYWRGSSVFRCDSRRNQSYQEPWVLLPPHSAPLDLHYAGEHSNTALSGRLLVVLHGYRGPGQRIIALPVDQNGVPELASESGYRESVAGSNREKVHAYRPDGGLLRQAEHIEIVSGWSALEGVRPRGAPASITRASDGSFWIAEDKNGAIVRLAAGRSENPGEDEDETDRLQRQVEQAVAKVQSSAELSERWQQLRDRVLARRCVSCHSGLIDTAEFVSEVFAGIEFMVRQGSWLPTDASRGQLFERTHGIGGGQRMPLGGRLTQQEQAIVDGFVEAYRR